MITTSNPLFDKIKSDPQYYAGRSVNWFQKKVRDAFGSRISAAKMMQASQAQLTTSILPGSMYAYVYFPKGEKTLPYYDMFPLNLPFGQDKTGFIGLNLHYLPYRIRLVLLDKLMDFAVKNKAGRVAYLKFSWALISDASQLPEVRPCVKRYLWKQMRSKFVYIPTEDWVLASMLPTANFKKMSEETVWRDSIKKIRKEAAK